MQLLSPQRDARNAPSGEKLLDSLCHGHRLCRVSGKYRLSERLQVRQMTRGWLVFLARYCGWEVALWGGWGLRVRRRAGTASTYRTGCRYALESSPAVYMRSMRDGCVGQHCWRSAGLLHP
jgi:hypothetical protein